MRDRLALIFLLAIASILRLALAVQGGQLYWPVETRYAQALGGSGKDTLPLAGIVASQISVVAIGLVYAIARRAGRSRLEALIAAGLMASATTMLYYARHLLPYDLSMALGLFAMWFGLRSSPRNSVLCGVAAGAALVAYPGCWLFVAAVLLMHVVHEGRATLRPALNRAVLAGLGILIIPIVVTAVGKAGAASWASSLRDAFPRDGYAPEGFTVTWAYLWHAEHGLLLLWCAAALLVAFDIRSDPRGRRTASVWLISAGCIYLGLALGSSVWHLFAVTGRLSRQLVPLLCLGAGVPLAAILEHRRARWIVVACGAALVLQVAWNFRQPLQQRFPRDVEAEIIAKYGPVDHDLTLTGSELANGHVESQWVLLNGQHLDRPRIPRPPLPAGIIEILRFPHPLQFLPYQYEGFGPTERQLLRTNDIAMRLIDIGVPVDALP